VEKRFNKKYGKKVHAEKDFFKKRKRWLPPSVWAAALREEGFKKIMSPFFPECLGQALRKRVFKKMKCLPRVLHSGKRFPKKRRMAPTASNLPRVLGRHSGKASPSARDLALGEGLFPVNGFPGRPSPSVALREVFPECFGVFPECI
jgi:hypothetical protein